MMETPEVAVHDSPRTVEAGDFRPATADPEVVEKARRRRFSASYKLRVLEEVDRNPGRAGLILRREGLYSSHLSAWRKQRREGTLKALGRRRGPKTKKTAEGGELEKLRRDNARLRKKLDHAEKIITVQKKLSEVLGVQLEEESLDATELD